MSSSAIISRLLSRRIPKPDFVFDFMRGTPDSRITTSGGTNGTITNSAGAIVAATCPRIDYDPVTLASFGTLRETSTTNLLLNSLLDGTNLSTQSVTVTAAVHTLSFYGTGTVTLSGVSTSGPAVGSGAYPTRTTLTFTPTAGSLTLTVTGTVQFAQLELGLFASTFVPTAGSAVTRTADSLLWNGASFSSLFNPLAWTIMIEFRAGQPAGRMLSISNNGGSAEVFDAFLRTAVNGMGISTTLASVLTLNVFLQTSVTNQNAVYILGSSIRRIVIGYSSGVFYHCHNGNTVYSVVGTTPANLNTMDIGGRSTTVSGLSGHIRQVQGWSRLLSKATMQKLKMLPV